MYDKDEINSIAILYSVDPKVQYFEGLLKALTPMINYVLLRHPEVQEHWEDIRQEILIAIWDNLTGPDKLKLIFEGNVPADYFYFRIRRWANYHSSKIKSEYDMYNPVVKSIEDLSAKEKAQVTIDPNGEDFDEWA